jgi:hypothetical protein
MGRIIVRHLGVVVVMCGVFCAFRGVARAGTVYSYSSNVFGLTVTLPLNTGGAASPDPGYITPTPSTPSVSSAGLLQLVYVDQPVPTLLLTQGAGLPSLFIGYQPGLDATPSIGNATGWTIGSLLIATNPASPPASTIVSFAGQVEVTDVPEPGNAFLVGLGIAALIARRRGG